MVLNGSCTKKNGPIHKETGETIGNLTVYNRVPECVANHKAVQGKNGKALSFAVLPAFRRKGFMYEAVSNVIEHLFREEKADYINCGHLSYNTPSKALQEKLGFTYLLTEQFRFDDQEIASIENILWRNSNEISKNRYIKLLGLHRING